ncbi:MAG TPA: dihydrolipoamide acetyltransferase family protein [Chloroflexota bacterium]|nr:dihydrolipoamide acetyltransferase family protein [Chloroflexota bacterium]
MLKEVILPTLGLDIEEAVVQTWLKKEGDAVAKDEPLVVVETDKAVTEINAPVSGILKQIVQHEGSTAKVTHVIAIVATEASDELPATPISVQAPTPIAAATGPNGGSSTRPAAPASTVSVEDQGKVRASPAARHAARELNVDLSMVTGTGPGGRIQGDDVRDFAKRAQQTGMPVSPILVTPPPSQSTQTADLGGIPGRIVPLSRKRRITAERMALSARTVARLTMNMRVDATEMIRLRERLQPSYAARGGRLTHNDLLIKVVAMALVDHPYLNARWTDQGIALLQQINVGVAVAVSDGLVVTVIHNADRKRLEEISAESAGLVTKARADTLSVSDITGGTFTITNLGMYGVESFTPIVNPPEAAILGVGAMEEQPVSRDGQMVLRPMMTLSLSFDHRIVDGAPAAEFLKRVKQLLEEPYLLL